MQHRLITTLCLCLGIILPIGGCETDSEDAAGDQWHGSGIVGGTPSEYETWKGVIGLVTLQQGQPMGICTGTLIHPEVVLTAGHCVKMKGGFFSATYDHTKKPENLLVKDGAIIGIAGQKGDLLSEVKAAVHHPDWQGDITIVSQQDWNSGSPTKSFVDLALVHLKTPVTKYGTYCVREDSSMNDGDTGIIVGYGLLGSNRQMSGGVHRWGETTLLRANSDKTQNYIEIGNPSNTCQGDSGGPLFTQVGESWKITGVTSHGSSGMCLPRKQAFSTNVVKHYDWINNQIKEWTGDALDSCTLRNGDGGLEDDLDPETDTEEDAGPGGDDTSKGSSSSCRVTVPPGETRPMSLLTVLTQLFFF